MAEKYDIKLKARQRAEAEHYCSNADAQEACHLWIIEASEQDGIWYYVEHHNPRHSTPFVRINRERVIRRPCACGAAAEVIDMHGFDACHACADCLVQWESKRL